MSDNNDSRDEQDDYVSEVQSAIAQQEIEIKKLQNRMTDLTRQLSEAKVSLTLIATTTFEEWKANGRKF